MKKYFFESPELHHSSERALSVIHDEFVSKRDAGQDAVSAVRLRRRWLRVDSSASHELRAIAACWPCDPFNGGSSSVLVLQCVSRAAGAQSFTGLLGMLGSRHSAEPHHRRRKRCARCRRFRNHPHSSAHYGRVWFPLPLKGREIVMEIYIFWMSQVLWLLRPVRVDSQMIHLFFLPCQMKFFVLIVNNWPYSTKNCLWKLTLSFNKQNTYNLQCIFENLVI